jgi:hypothetical protein
MYIQARNGLRGLGDGEVTVPTLDTTYTATPVDSGGSFDFSKLLSTIVSGASSVYQAKSATDIAKLQTKTALATEQAKQNALIYANNSQNAPVFSTGNSSSWLLPVALAGGAAILLYFLFKD